jgi:Putative Ig domain
MSARLRFLVALLAAALVCAAPSTAAADPPVTVISDSVLTSILWYTNNLDVLDQGYTVNMNVAVGRRLAGTSIPFDGVAAPTLLALVPNLPIYPTVIVEMGYNDDPTAFHDEAEQAIDLLVARGATRIIWPTLSESKPEYAAMNQSLRELLIAHPQLTLADWNGYSAAHPDWFQNDHLHLMPAGGLGMATLLHGALTSPLAFGSAQVGLPSATVGKRFSAPLQAPATGGPVTWSIGEGALPPGLALQGNGVVSGVPRKAGSYRFDALAETTNAQIGHVDVTLTVGRAPVAIPVLGSQPKQHPAAKKQAASKKKAAKKKHATRRRPVLPR